MPEPGGHEPLPEKAAETRGAAAQPTRNTYRCRNQPEETGMKTEHRITKRDRDRAQRCVECAVCETARRKQRGFAYWFVRKIEGGLCPYCKAYEKVYGRKAHEPLPEAEQKKRKNP